MTIILLIVFAGICELGIVRIRKAPKVAELHAVLVVSILACWVIDTVDIHHHPTLWLGGGGLACLTVMAVVGIAVVVRQAEQRLGEVGQF